MTAYLVAKRLIDVVLAATGLVLLSPLLLLISLAILIEDGRPILFRQLRWGRDRKQFVLYKFRTMRTGPDHGEKVVQAREFDPRVTSVGRFLRMTGMDEIPQFVNILKGDMSLVGPRALAVGETAELESGSRIAYEDADGFDERLMVSPGLTGLATVYASKDAPAAVKFEHDLRYVASRSILLDIKLIALSIWISLRGRWETRSPKL